MTEFPLKGRKKREYMRRYMRAYRKKPPALRINGFEPIKSKENSEWDDKVLDFLALFDISDSQKQRALVLLKECAERDVTLKYLKRKYKTDFYDVFNLLKKAGIVQRRSKFEPITLSSRFLLRLEELAALYREILTEAKLRKKLSQK